MSERPVVTVGGLIFAPDGDLFLVKSHKWNHLYSLPGGKVELGETREAAFEREVREETGLKIVNIRFAIVQDCIFSPDFYKANKHFVMNDFLADLEPRWSKDQVVLNDEAEEYCWVSPRKALEMALQEKCRYLIEWYLTQNEV